MGQFRFELVIDSTTSACNVQRIDGAIMSPDCGAAKCPLCMVRRFVEQARTKLDVEAAALWHEPGTSGAQMVDGFNMATTPASITRRSTF